MSKRKEQFDRHEVRVSITTGEFDKFIKDHLSYEDREKFPDCTWLPVKVLIFPGDPIPSSTAIEVFAFPVKLKG